jgi:hypothetical protein
MRYQVGALFFAADRLMRQWARRVLPALVVVALRQ